MKIGRNQRCPCHSGKKFKKCCGMLRVQPEVAPVVASTTNIVPSFYQPIAAHGYAPWQFDEMLRFAQQMRPAR